MSFPHSLTRTALKVLQLAVAAFKPSGIRIMAYLYIARTVEISRACCSWEGEADSKSTVKFPGKIDTDITYCKVTAGIDYIICTGGAQPGALQNRIQSIMNTTLFDPFVFGRF